MQGLMYSEKREKKSLNISLNKIDNPKDMIKLDHTDIMWTTD